MAKVSVIMPAYNAQDSIGRAIRSVLDTPRRSELEIIVVDDCSKDDTCGVIRDIQKNYDNIKLLFMPENSGSPSGPRNMGIENATGDYITFLDDDDWFDANRLMKMADYAAANDLDFLKGYLMVVGGNRKQIYNRLPKAPENTLETIKAIMAHHSTNSDFLVRREVLLQHNLRYGLDLKIGEDTVFTADILVHCQSVGYMDEYFMYHTIGSMDISNVSSTQRCGDKEIKDQIAAWERTQTILSQVNMNYYKLRLHVGMRNLLMSIVQYSDGISENTYNRLCSFAQETKGYVKGKMNLHPRYGELYDAILSGDFPEYLNAAKTRLLINGYDLKFVLPVIPYLSDTYNIRVDEWTGHASHDEKQSLECAKWADIIWCEWMLGNALYYTKFKNKNQRLIVRAHRFEITRDFGYKLDFAKVDMVVTVGYYYFEQFAKQFSIPRGKMRLLSNYVEDSIYSQEKTPDARYHLGLVGILPARKGFHRGLEILKALREQDTRFKLYIMGKGPGDVPWIKNNPAEADYFVGCDKYIADNGLTDAVVYGGFVERRDLYRDIGYVLSLSDDELPESFHLAPAEGACAGSMGMLLRWPGVEYIYPPDVLYHSLEEITQGILDASRNVQLYDQQAATLQEYVLEHYGMDRFLDTLRRYLKQLYILE